MSKGFIVGLLLLVIAAGIAVVYNFKGGSIDFGGGSTVETVRFSVIRYDGKIVSSRLVIDGAGRLQSKHRVNEDKVGVAYYKFRETVDQIQSCESYRYIMNDNGFTQEVITKEVTLE